MSEAALRNELAAIRLLVGIPDDQSIIGYLRELKKLCKNNFHTWPNKLKNKDR